MVSESIGLGILTRGRPDVVLRCIHTAHETVGCDLKVYCLFDDDHRSAWNVMMALEGKLGIGGTNIKVLPLRHYYTRGMNTLYQWMRPHVDYFVVSNDDVTFTMQGWGPYVISRLQDQFPDGEGILELAGAELAAHYATRASFIDREFDGLLAEPAYTFYCSDTELRNRAKALGRYGFQPAPGGGTVLRHDVKQDHHRSEVDYWMASDRETFKRRAREHPEWQREIWQ